MNRKTILFLVLASLSGCVTGACSTTTTVLVTRNNTVATCVAREKSYECGSLQSALDFVALVGDTTNDQSCTVVLVPSGVHTLKQNVTISKNVVIRGSRGTIVTFNFSSDLLASVRQLAVLSLKNTYQVSIENIVFENSPGYIEIVNVTRIYLTKSTFRFFIQGAVNVYNFRTITVDKCVFEHNGPASSIKFTNYLRGHCGGLAISHHKYPPYHDHVVVIKNTVFSNNSALPTTTTRLSTTDTYRESVFTGKGGGLGLFLGAGTIDVEVTNCSFLSNVALSYGGGLYAIIDSKANHSVLIQDCLLRRNRCLFSAGALFIGFRDSGSSVIHSSVITRNVICKENVARQAGCVHAFSPGHQKKTVYNYLKFENCMFLGNIAYEYAAAISLNTINMINQLNYSNPTKVIDCKFVNNSSPLSGTVGIAFVPIIFQGVNIFYQNTGEAMQIAGSLVHFYGRLDFIDQQTVGSPDGALSVTSLGQVVLHKGARISFINNTGVVGAAISVESQKISNVFSKLLFNPLCFLRYEDPKKSPDSWEDVEIYFSGNSAIEAPVAVIYLLNLCSWVGMTHPFFNPITVLKWKFIKFGENRNLFHLKNNSSEFFIRSHAVTLDIGNQTIDAYPGEIFGLNVSIKDEFKKTIGGTFRFEAKNLANSNETIIFKPAASVHHREDEILKKKLVTSENYTSNAVNTYTASASSFFSTVKVHGTTKVNVRHCPPGSILAEIKGSADTHSKLCRCNSDHDPAVLTCEKNKVILNGNLWASEDISYSSDSLFVSKCPADYCRCELDTDSMCVHSFLSEEPDEQCACGRKGVLCGECSNSSFGVSVLLNRCVTCHDAFGLLIALLILVDVAIVIFVLKIFTGRKYPAWIYSCLFYIQALPHITEHFKEGFGLFRQLLYYISNATSLYFSYDFCLYSNMSALVSYSLRFIPSIIAASTTSTYLAISWNFRRHRANWHAVWLLLILIYTQTVHTSLSILNCPIVHFNNTRTRRWFVAGHVTCFTGSHTGLAVMAALMLALCALAIIISFILSLYHTERIVWLKRLSRAVRYPFKHQYRWWYSVELARRFVIVLITVLFPQNNYPSLFFQCIFMVIFLYTQPYISTAANVAEAILSISTVFMLLESLCDFEIHVPIVLRAKCADENSIITLNTVLRAVPFYVPLVVTVGLAILSIVRILRKKRQEGQSRQKEDQQLSPVSVSIVRNPHSTTYIDIRQPKSVRLPQPEENTSPEPVYPLVETTV